MGADRIRMKEIIYLLWLRTYTSMSFDEFYKKMMEDTYGMLEYARTHKCSDA